MAVPTSVMALDMGHKRIGVAIAGNVARIANPLVTLSHDKDVFEQIMELVKEHRVTTVVLGLPRGLEGQETQQTQAVRDFAEELKEQTELPVIFQDEALTSVTAEEVLRQRKKFYTKEDIDMYAASQILEDYLNLPEPKEAA